MSYLPQPQEMVRITEICHLDTCHSMAHELVGFIGTFRMAYQTGSSDYINGAMDLLDGPHKGKWFIFSAIKVQPVGTLHQGRWFGIAAQPQQPIITSKGKHHA